MIGTTIAPWMMFFAQSNVVEKGVAVKDLFSQKVDVIAGTIAACLVAWFIIVTTGAGAVSRRGSRSNRPPTRRARWRRSPGTTPKRCSPSG